MAPPLGGLAGLLERQAGEALAFGLGFALGRALEPAGVELAQEAWKVAPIRAPDAGTMAAGVAQGQVERDKAAGWAREHGYDGEAFAAMVDVANTGPAIGLAMQAWRRGEFSDAEFVAVLKRSGLEEQWNAALMALKEERLDLGAIATAIHRGIIAGEGLIVREPPRGEGRIPQVPRSSVDATAEAEAHGIDPERLRVLVGNTGLPPGLGEMLQLLNRGRVTEDDVRRAVAQSNLRNEYMDAVLELRRRLLTPHEYVEAHLRGWISEAEMHAGAGLVGMEAADADLMFKVQGRPITTRQITTGLARGGRYGGDYEGVPEPYNKALRESNTRPEWGNLAYANRYTLPSAFVLRGMASAGELTGAETEQLLLQSGWPPELAKKVAARWAGSTQGAGKQETKAELADEYEGGYLAETEYRAELAKLGYTGHTQDLLVHLGDARRIKRWREKIVDAIGSAYLAFKIDDAQAASELAELNIAGQAASLLVALWAKQRRDTVRLLTPAQIVKSFKKGMISREQALEELGDREYSPGDAVRLLGL